MPDDQIKNDRCSDRNIQNKPSSDFLKTLAELEIDDEMDLNELDLESSAESQSISSTETPHEQTNERKRKVFNGFLQRNGEFSSKLT